MMSHCGECNADLWEEADAPIGFDFERLEDGRLRFTDGDGDVLHECAI